MLRHLSVLKLNGNRLGEECTFTLQRMAEKSSDLSRALTARGWGRGATDSSTSPNFEGVELFPFLQVIPLEWWLHDGDRSTSD